MNGCDKKNGRMKKKLWFQRTVVIIPCVDGSDKRCLQRIFGYRKSIFGQRKGRIVVINIDDIDDNFGGGC